MLHLIYLPNHRIGEISEEKGQGKNSQDQHQQPPGVGKKEEGRAVIFHRVHRHPITSSTSSSSVSHHMVGGLPGKHPHLPQLGW